MDTDIGSDINQNKNTSKIKMKFRKYLKNSTAPDVLTSAIETLIFRSSCDNFVR